MPRWHEVREVALYDGEEIGAGVTGRIIEHPLQQCL
jgi:hypothetical protein